MGFPDSSVGKESACKAGDLGSIPRLGRSPGEGQGYPLQYSGLENYSLYSPLGCKELDMTERLYDAAAAAAAAKSLQLCPTLCSPRDGSPRGSAIPGFLQARTLEWVAI